MLKENTHMSPAPANAIQTMLPEADSEEAAAPLQPASDQVLRQIVWDARYAPHYTGEDDLDRTDEYMPRTDEHTLRGAGRELELRGLVPATPDEILAAAHHVDKIAARKRRNLRNKVFSAEVGPRYDACTFNNYQATLPAQKAAVATAKDYVGKIHEHVEQGAGLLLFGPAGTGKDHLLCAAARFAINHDVAVRWRNGRDLFGLFRDRMKSDEDSEEELVSELVTVQVLAISDPLPPSGAWSQYQSDMLFRILDGRYRAIRPTWATMNVTDGSEADSRIGAQLVDRLRHGAVAIHCNWPSYRKSQTYGTTPTEGREQAGS